MSKLTFEQLASANLARVCRWHKGGLDEWSPSDWAVALTGEIGEACNAIKKLKRVEDGIANLSAEPERQLSTRRDAIEKIADELADTAIYLDLLAQRLGIDLEASIREKFNSVSLRYGFPERL
jgi:NTP pyrophosphatase (non-canonical NTP hydrolase)